MKRGFTIFFATLVASLALAIGIAIYDLVVRQLDLSTTVTQSQSAIFAADSGVECALYWDSKYPAGGSAFATSSASAPPSSGILCGGEDAAAHGTAPTPFAPYSSSWASWTIQSVPAAATTTFTLTFPPYNYCATVQVTKFTRPDGLIGTVIYSHGFNTCYDYGQAQLEREFKVSY